ncbi:MAG TPA: hypothetical protein VHJ20_11135 [Polyangia bacterium]|nr:hypothetical protein [Polyangia bacterium]
MPKTKKPVEAQDNKKARDAEHQHHGPAEPTAEEIRSGSRTAQDREHTTRGGDDQTAPMKEFPT